MSRIHKRLILNKFVENIRKELAEKDAMIDWLANQLATNAVIILPVEYTSRVYYDRNKINEWRKAAQEAVKKND